MEDCLNTARIAPSIATKKHPEHGPERQEACFFALGIDPDRPDFYDRLPFGENDITAGSETELQAIVIGDSSKVDLPIAILESRYYANLQRRTRSGDAPERLLNELHAFLHDSGNRTWENSWFRFARRRLSPFAVKVFERDLLSDKQRPQDGQRSDAERFQFVGKQGEPWLRVPLSYLLKLALADLLGNPWQPDSTLHQVGAALQREQAQQRSSW
jgi:hypothetical protein